MADMIEPRPLDDDGKMRLELKVNGRVHRVRARAHHTLLEVLRDQLKLFGAREACGVGMCGACTVLLDGKPVSGCLMLAALAEGKDILTTKALLEENPDPTEDQARHYLAGNLCRCGSYVKIIDAVMDAKTRLRQ